jgi:hypothetical protein
VPPPQARQQHHSKLLFQQQSLVHALVQHPLAAPAPLLLLQLQRSLQRVPHRCLQPLQQQVGTNWEQVQELALVLHLHLLLLLLLL